MMELAIEKARECSLMKVLEHIPEETVHQLKEDVEMFRQYSFISAAKYLDGLDLAR